MQPRLLPCRARRRASALAPRWAALAPRWAALAARWAALAALALLATLWSAACPGKQEEARPAGLYLVGQGPALARALEVAARLSGTPLGDASARALPVVRPCARVVAAAPSGKLEELLEALRCAEPEGPLAELAASQGTAELVVASGTGGPWTIFSGKVDERGSLEGESRLPLEQRGMGTLLAPAGSAPPAARLASAGALIHGRMRVRGGIDLEKLKTKGKSSEKMKLPDFAGVLSGTLLDGTWELAVYGPPEARTVPRIVLALGVSSTRAARAGMDALLGELEGTWHLHRSAFRVGQSEGACLLDLTVLPDLAPCFVLAGDALAIGWNQEALQHALGAAPGPDATPPAGGLLVDFDGMRPVDEALTRTAFPDGAPRAGSWPWSRLVVEAVGEGRVHIALRAAEGQP